MKLETKIKIVSFDFMNRNLYTSQNFRGSSLCSFLQRLTSVNYDTGFPLPSSFWIILAYGWHQQETKGSPSVLPVLVGGRQHHLPSWLFQS